MVTYSNETGFGIVTLSDLPKGTRIPFYGSEKTIEEAKAENFPLMEEPYVETRPGHCWVADVNRPNYCLLISSDVSTCSTRNCEYCIIEGNTHTNDNTKSICVVTTKPITAGDVLCVRPRSHFPPPPKHTHQKSIHRKRTHTRTGYPCRKCFKRFKSVIGLHKHVERHRLEAGVTPIRIDDPHVVDTKSERVTRTRFSSRRPSMFRLDTKGEHDTDSGTNSNKERQNKLKESHFRKRKGQSQQYAVVASL